MRLDARRAAPIRSPQLMTERLREKEKKKEEEKPDVSVTLCHPAYRGGARFSPIFCLHKSPINNTINAYATGTRILHPIRFMLQTSRIHPSCRNKPRREWNQRRGSS